TRYPLNSPRKLCAFKYKARFAAPLFFFTSARQDYSVNSSLSSSFIYSNQSYTAVKRAARIYMRDLMNS
ncbi:hypothetical protein, partial [Nitrosomonas aestuarii]|uniref:hypothetical protein n=1 Tax=Nitrosomonas aestuarii TaxID=52441 RepID=UPI001C626CEF